MPRRPFHTSQASASLINASRPGTTMGNGYALPCVPLYPPQMSQLIFFCFNQVSRIRFSTRVHRKEKSPGPEDRGHREYVSRLRSVCLLRFLSTHDPARSVTMIAVRDFV